MAGVNRLMGFQPPLVSTLIINNINRHGIKEKEHRLVGPKPKQSGAKRLNEDCCFGKLSVFVKTADIILNSSNVTCSRHDIEDGTHANIIVFDCMESTIYHDQVDQELLTLPEHLSLSPIFNGVRVTRSLVLCVMFCRSLFVLFSLGLCVFCASSIYGF